MRVLSNKIKSCIALALFLSVCVVQASQAGVITKAAREVQLTDPDVVILINQISFKPGSANVHNRKTIFEYVVASDYSDTLMDLVAFDSDTMYKVKVEKADGPIVFDQALTSYNSTDFLWFRIDVSNLLEGDTVNLEINEYHKLRKKPFPERLALNSQQTVRFSDSRYMLSPYQVQSQTTVYGFPPGDLEEYTESDSASKVSKGVKYGPYKHIGPFSFDLVSVLFKSVEPMLILNEATKTVTVSHWGLIAVDEYFVLENIGAELKGEFNRVDFHQKGNGQNCMRQMVAKYPWYIQNMYFNDYIGNISSTNAIRLEENVNVEFYPRYPICGGWKVDWNMGYKMPTKYHLSRPAEEDDLYSLDINFLHNYDILLAENYTFEVILPYGAYDIKYELPFEINSSSLEKSTMTLDFFGTPKLVLKKQNVFSHLHNLNLKVTYRFDQRFILIKPLGLSLTVFAFYLAAITYSRISLSFAVEKNSKVHRD